MVSVIYIGFVSFFTAFLGFFMSFVISLIHGKTSVRQTGFILGLTGGVLISIICFELLPEAMAYYGITYPITAMTVALIVCAYLEHYVEKLKDVAEVKPLDVINISIISGVTIGLNNVPEGFALGSVLAHANIIEMHMIYALFLHCVLDGLLVFMSVSYKNLREFKNLAFIVITSSVISVGAIIGAFLTGSIHIVMPISVGFVSGIMLYVALGEVIPKSKQIWNGRFSTLGACIGVIIGIVIKGS